MRLGRAQVKHVLGWAGGLVERSEPDVADADLRGRLRAGENFVHTAPGRLQVRGGARVALQLTGNAITSIVGVYPWSPTGGLVVAHRASGGGKHYAVAVTERGAVALPVSTPTESGSTSDLAWNSTTIAWPVAVELFETLFLVDPAGNHAMRSCKLSGGSLVTADVTADLDGDNTPAPLRPRVVEVYNSVLLVAGWEDESIGDAPHLVRHSLLGQDPATAAGWDPEAFAIIGAHGQPVRAMKAGLGACLVAKETTLFRLTGYPDAGEGWQFGIQQVENTLGAGCVNAHALEFAEGRWWGVGQNGPWSYDGQQVTNLRSSRAASWGRIGDLARSFVRYHPRRRAILFGFDEPTAAVAGERASRLWAYDLRSDTWAPDYRSHARFWMVSAITQAGGQLTDRPTALTWQNALGTFEMEAITFTFVPGDPTAQTEVWLQPSGGSYALVQTLAANQRGARIAGLERGRRYNVKLRHRQGDAVTEFGPEVAMYTQVPAVRVNGRPNNTLNGIQVVSDRAGRALQYQTTAGNNPISGTVNALPLGVRDIGWPTTPATNLASHVVNLTLQEPTHPIGYQNGPTVEHRQRSGFVSFSGAMPITQLIDPDRWAETSITVLLERHSSQYSAIGIYVAARHQLAYRRFGTTPWIIAREIWPTTWDSDGNGGSLLHTITGLIAGERYELRYNFIDTQFGSAMQTFTFIGHTKIPAPIASAVAVGAGTPSVNITARPGNGLTGFDMAIRNLSGAYDSLFTLVPSSDVVYNSTAGTCGVPDTYFVRARSTAWPAGLQYSDPAVLAIASPCL